MGGDENTRAASWLEKVEVHEKEKTKVGHEEKVEVQSHKVGVVHEKMDVKENASSTTKAIHCDESKVSKVWRTGDGKGTETKK